MERKEFRCPFEIQGHRQGAILDVTLDGGATERISTIRQAYASLDTQTKYWAICFLVPNAVITGCTSNEELRPRILPYQTELLAVELETQPAPFLPYQVAEASDEEYSEAVKGEFRRVLMTDALLRYMERKGDTPPKCTEDLATWLEKRFEQFYQRTSEILSIKLRGKRRWRKFWRRAAPILQIEDGTILFWMRAEDTDNPLRNHTKFRLVRTPFYPQGFGRWSNRVEIVVTRNVDFGRVPLETHLSIRRQSNSVLQAHGVRVPNDEWSVPSGLWLPKYK